MPFKKKSGGSRGGGRPNTMGIGAQGSGLNHEKFAEYQRKTSAKSRGQTSSPKARSHSNME